GRGWSARGIISTTPTRRQHPPQGEALGRAEGCAGGDEHHRAAADRNGEPYGLPREAAGGAAGPQDQQAPEGQRHARERRAEDGGGQRSPAEAAEPTASSPQQAE